MISASKFSIKLCNYIDETTLTHVDKISVSLMGEPIKCLRYKLNDFFNSRWVLCMGKDSAHDAPDIDVKFSGEDSKDYSGWKEWIEPYIKGPVSLGNLMFCMHHTLMPEVDKERGYDAVAFENYDSVSIGIRNVKFEYNENTKNLNILIPDHYRYQPDKK